MPDPETIIQAGLIFDGTGAPPRRLDIGLAGDRIVALETPGTLRADRIINAAGRWVCPGFIDTHSHSDTYLLLEPDAPSKIHQGITTEIIGQCGSSAEPLRGIRRLPADWQEKKYPATWDSMADYRRLLESSPCAVNIIALVGHNTLRSSIMGCQPRPAGSEELRSMVRMLSKCLAEGAWGWSTGLLYTPGKWAASGELQALASAVAAADGIYATHLRNEGAGLSDALDEALALSHHSGVRLQISHLKVTGAADMATADLVLEKLDAARRNGIDVAADKYPYEASCTDLDILLPDDFIRDGREATLQKLRTPSQCRQLAERLTAARNHNFWERITIAATFHPDTIGLQGMPLLEAARCLERPAPETVLFLIERDELKTSAFFFNMPPEPNRRLYEDNTVMIGTDASLRATQGVLAREFPHPRAYGTFPRFFRKGIDEFGWPAAEIIRRMTGWPAKHFRIPDRGVLRAGTYADLVILDPERFRDRSTYEDPRQPAEGIEHLLVNGIPVIANGRNTGQRPGRWLVPRQ